MRVLGLLVLVLSFAPASAMARCLAYEPSVVSLEGKLSSKTVPGPPNYGSLARGDLPETIFILQLDEPICVSSDPASRRNSKAHSGVTEIQLSISSAKVRPHVGKQVRATGSLTAAQSGHHRTPVILRVSKLEPE